MIHVGPSKPLRVALALLLQLLLQLLLSAPAQAHDSWFAPSAGAAPPQLMLGTGNQFPKQESGIDRQFLATSGCRAADGQRLPLSAVDDLSMALLLRPGTGARSCWAQLVPFEIVVAPELVEVYLKEIAASPALRRIWAERHARGVPWKERYTKHARIEMASADGDGSGPHSGPIAGLGLDIVPTFTSPARVGDSLAFQVLRDGQPLPGLPVELRSGSVRFGVWGQTDAEGRVQFKPPLPGRWLLRGVDLRVSASDPDAWDSRFVTLAFEVLPAAVKTAAP